MKFSSRFLFMSEFLMERKINLILSIILLTISFYLFDTTSTLRYSLNSEMREYEALYDASLKDVYILTLSVPENSLYFPDLDMVKIDECLKQSDQISAFGAYSYQSFPICDEWADNSEFEDIMNRRDLSALDELYLFDSRYLPVLCLQDSISDILPVSGVDRDLLLSADDAFRLPAYAGNAFRSIVSEGDILHFGDLEIKIVGFLEPGVRYASAPNMIGIGATYYTPRLLDYHLVVDMDCLKLRNLRYAYSGSMVRFVEPKQFENPVDIRQEIQNCLLGGLASVNMKSVESYLVDSREENKYEDEIYQRLYIFMFALCILTALSVTTISILTQKRKIGIWMANGFLQKDLVWMIVISGFVRMAVPFIIALSIRMWSFTSGTVTASYQIVHSSIVVPQMLLLMLLSYTLAVVVPVVYLKRQSVMEMLKEGI